VEKDDRLAVTPRSGGEVVEADAADIHELTAHAVPRAAGATLVMRRALRSAGDGCGKLERGRQRDKRVWRPLAHSLEKGIVTHWQKRPRIVESPITL
jgi:hypothetical protein